MGLHRYKCTSEVTTAQVIVSSGYCVEWKAAYLLGIRGTLSGGMMKDSGRNEVDMRVNTVSTLTADSLGGGKHETMNEGN